MKKFSIFNLFLFKKSCKKDFMNINVTGKRLNNKKSYKL
jgi:hypothetical protein